MATSQQGNAAIAQIVEDGAIQHQITHGGEDTQVQTDGGLVDSFSKTIKDLRVAGVAGGAAALVVIEAEVRALGDDMLEAADTRINTAADVNLAALNVRVNEDADGILADSEAARDVALGTIPQFAVDSPPPPVDGSVRQWTGKTGKEAGRTYQWLVTASGGQWVETGAVVSTDGPGLDAINEAKTARNGAVAAAVQTAADRAATLAAATSAAASTNSRPSVAIALADTTLAVGSSFSAPLANGSMQNYTKTSTSVATAFGAPYPSIAAYDGIIVSLSKINAVIGRPVGQTLFSDSTVASQHYVDATPAPYGGLVGLYELHAKTAGVVQLEQWRKTGAVVAMLRAVSVSVPAAGTNSLGIDALGGFAVEAGDFIGVSGNGIVTYDTNAADGPGFWFISAESETSPTLQPGYRFQQRFGLLEQTVSSDTFQALQDSTLPLFGKKYGVLADSLAAAYAQVWQDEFELRTGAVLWRQDARPGRSWPNALEGYGAANPLPSIGSLTGYSGATAISGFGTLGQWNVHGQVPAYGTSLAGWLADLDFLIVALGTNDAAFIHNVGVITDGYTSGTQNGAMNFVLDAIQTARPSLRILLVTNNYTTEFGTGTFAQGRATAAATVAMAKSRGLPVLDSYETSGIGPRTVTTLLRDGIHQTDACFRRVYARSVAALATSFGFSA